jgi:hypothetical protein
LELTSELEALEAELQRLTTAIAAGANFDAALAAIGERERKVIRLRREIASLDETTRACRSSKEIEPQLRARLDEWRGVLRQETPCSPQIMTKLLDDKTTSRRRPTRESVSFLRIDGQPRKRWPSLLCTALVANDGYSGPLTSPAFGTAPRPPRSVSGRAAILVALAPSRSRKIAGAEWRP